jgi:hypothetical protein
MHPIALCLERLDEPGSPMVRCVALPGGQPGLCITISGPLEWLSVSHDAAVELWVTADGRLALRRGDGSPELLLRRAQRTLQVPPAKPVILLDGDELETSLWTYKLFVHGATDSVASPEPLPRRSTRRVVGAAAAALAVAALGGQASAIESAPDAGPEAGATEGGAPEQADGSAPIEIRDHPPAPPPPVHGGCCGTKPGYDTAFRK